MGIYGKQKSATGAAGAPGSSSILEGSDFSILSAPRLQACVLVSGDGGSGKSTFGALYVPDPVAFINYDRRASHAVARAMAQGKRVYYTQVDYPANVTKLGDEMAKKHGQAAIDKTIRNLEWAVRESQKGNVRTITFDTATEYSEMVKLAITGRIDKTKGDYGKSKDLINREWWRVFNIVREGNAHLILLSRARAIWVDNEPTGRFTFRCPDVVNDGVDWAAQIRLKRGVKGRQKREFELEVTKAGVNIEELGSVYSEAEWGELGGPFVYACLLQYEGSSLEDWS